MIQIQKKIAGKNKRWMLLPLLFLLIAGLFSACSAEEEIIHPPTFPSLHITVPEDPFVQEREHWQTGTLSLNYARNGEWEFEEIETRFRGRGNSTWWLTEDKRPLRFRFEEAQSLLGSDYVATDWILLANHFDRSLLRNYAALTLGVMLDGLDFTPVPHHVHVYVNGEYMGVYLLTDERDVITGRMEITWDEDPTISEYFIELDARAYQLGGIENDTFVIADGLMYDIRYPGNRSRRTPAHVAYVREYLEQVGEVLRSGDFAAVEAIIDLDSFMDFYIVQEFMKNNDGHFLSVFMTIRGQGEGRRLYMGPVWDFDIAAGNLYNQNKGEGPEHLFIGVYNTWYRYLLQMPEFFALMSERWQAVSENEIPQMLAHVEQVAEEYQAEFLRNFQRHPITEIYIRNMPLASTIRYINSFEGHVNYLLGWFHQRQQWLDYFFGGFPPTYDLRWHLVEYYTYFSPIHLVLHDIPWNFQAPRFVYHYQTMLLAQEVAALFGLAAQLDAEENVLYFERDGVLLRHEIGSSIIYKNGDEFDFGVVVTMQLRGYTFVWVRAIAEILEYDMQTRNGSIHIGHFEEEAEELYEEQFVQ